MQHAKQILPLRMGAAGFLVWTRAVASFTCVTIATSKQLLPCKIDTDSDFKQKVETERSGLIAVKMHALYVRPDTNHVNFRPLI